MKIIELQKELESLMLNLTDSNYQEQFRAGFQMLVDFKNLGGNQQEVYDKLLPLHNKYKDMDERKYNLISDWLDCIIGFVGNKDWYIWNE